MGVYWYGVNGRGQSKGDEQIVGKGAKNTTDENISSLLASSTDAQGNHFCSSAKRHDSGSDNPLAQPNHPSQTKSSLHNGWPSYSHGHQAPDGQQGRFPTQTR